MKRFFLVAVVAAFVFVSASAQKIVSGSIDSLAGLRKIQIDFHFPVESVVCGDPLPDFWEKHQAVYNNPDPRFKNFYDQWFLGIIPNGRHCFKVAFNKVALKKGLPILCFTKDEYPQAVLKVTFKWLKRNGAALANYVFETLEGKELVNIEWESPKGGKFGTMNNLFSDANGDNGTAFAKYLAKVMKKGETPDSDQAGENRKIDDDDYVNQW